MIRKFDIQKIPTPPLADLKAARSWLTQQTHKKLHIDVGVGVGMSSIKLAQAHPCDTIIAIERTSDKFTKLAGRARAHDLKNLFIIHGEAIVFLPHLLKDNSIDHYYFLYPNPYPKNSQKNLRWGNSSFMHFVHSSLKAHGDLSFATNEEFYKNELVENIPQFGFSLNSQKILDKDFTPRTHFEKKYLLRGETCWDLLFSK